MKPPDAKKGPTQLIIENKFDPEEINMLKQPGKAYFVCSKYKGLPSTKKAENPEIKKVTELFIFKYLLRSDYVPHTIISTRDTAVNKNK